jgi:hypothetical protein
MQGIGKPERLEEWFETPGRVYVVIEEEKYKEVRGALSTPAYVVHRRYVDGRYILLISNRPDPGESDGR